MGAEAGRPRQGGAVHAGSMRRAPVARAAALRALGRQAMKTRCVRIALMGVGLIGGLLTAAAPWSAAVAVSGSYSSSVDFLIQPAEPVQLTAATWRDFEHAFTGTVEDAGAHLEAGVIQPVFFRPADEILDLAVEDELSGQAGREIWRIDRLIVAESTHFLAQRYRGNA